MVNEYVNSAAARSREKKRADSGGTQVVLMVGISFGLLCVLQSVLNISLRLQSERNQPIQDKDLLQENEEINERNRWLVKRNQELQDKTKELQDQMETVVNTINDLQRFCQVIVPPSCPDGWTRYRSSCYQISETANSWPNAKQDCERRGAQLVIFDDQEEEGVLYQFDSYDVMWTGLTAKNHRVDPTAWMWVDETEPTYNQWNGAILNTRDGESCAFHQRGLLRWRPGDCNSLFYWMCERELSTNK